MIKLSKRLESLAKYITNNDNVMDVGCDHAKLDIFLKEIGHPNVIYACDVNPNALKNGINNIEKYDMVNKIVPILGYGIEKLTEYEADTLIISGMGAKNIIDILNSPNLVRIYKLVLQSNNNHYDLRAFLKDKKFNIVEEEVIKDGKKTYVNIIAIREKYPYPYSEIELEFGPILMKRSINKEYFENLKDSYEKLYDKNKSEDVKRKISELEGIIRDL